MATKTKIKDQPGAVRISPEGDLAFLTADTDNAPWYHVTRGGQRYFATHEDVQDWPLRPSY